MTDWWADVKHSLARNGSVALPKNDENESRTVDVRDNGTDVASGSVDAAIKIRMYQGKMEASSFCRK